MSNKITGRVTLQVNGKNLLSKRGATLDYGGVKRTPIMGSNQVNGYSEEIMAPTVNCTISHTAATSLAELANYVDETLIFQTDVGRVYVLSQAFLTEPPKLAENEGDVSLAFAAVTCDET